jgi:hypothetical protein
MLEDTACRGYIMLGGKAGGTASIEFAAIDTYQKP